MNHWFEALQQALDREGIPNNPDKARYVPVQHYAESLADLRGALARWHRERLPAGGRIRVFVDGVSKRCAEGPETDIDGAFRSLLAAAGIPYRWTDLSAALALPRGDLHASHD